MSRRIPQLLKPIPVVTRLILIHRLILLIPLALLRQLLRRGLDVDIFEVALVCDFALLTVVAGPFAVTLEIVVVRAFDSSGE